jgi:DNA invertase Pin-like site-specific DNA recombinase
MSANIDFENSTSSSSVSWGHSAEFERALIRERPREGIAIAKKAGVYKGRKPSLTPDCVTELRARVAAGEKKAALAREYSISHETLYQYVPVER